MSNTLVNRAKHHFDSGYNCAEALLLAAVESYDLGLQPGEVRLAAGFGGGLGRGDICGALTGAVIALGAALGRNHHDQDPTVLKELREQIVLEFEVELGSLQCRELKTEDRQDCVHFIHVAAVALDKVLVKRL